MIDLYFLVIHWHVTLLWFTEYYSLLSGLLSYPWNNNIASKWFIGFFIPYLFSLITINHFSDSFLMTSLSDKLTPNAIHLFVFTLNSASLGIPRIRNLVKRMWVMNPLPAWYSLPCMVCRWHVGPSIFLQMMMTYSIGLPAGLCLWSAISGTQALLLLGEPFGAWEAFHSAALIILLKMSAM